jgi:aminomethyltransferase
VPTRNIRRGAAPVLNLPAAPRNLDNFVFEDEKGQKIDVQYRGRSIQGLIVEKNLSSEAPPYAHPVLVLEKPVKKPRQRSLKDLATELMLKAVQNNGWRQKESFNLIPSEQTPSLLVKLFSMMDPSGRYAEHRKFEAFEDKEIFYYQGTKWVEEIETQVMEEFQNFLGCSEVETRVISGQMANTAVFSGLMDYLNRFDRKGEPRRIMKVMNHHLGRGGHLSAQPMGALKDFIANDPQTERPAAVLVGYVLTIVVSALIAWYAWKWPKQAA